VIDVHHHFLPDDYRNALTHAGHSRPDGMGSIPEWSEQHAIDFIDEMGIETAFLSISSPGVMLGGYSAVNLSRAANETAAALMADYPGRFGSFATLPLPSAEASLLEIAYAFDTLHVDGVTLLTNYGGVYLGDPSLDPVFDELHRRKATVFVHPTSPAGCDQTSLGLPRPGIEFMFDTTRTVTNLIYSGTMDRCADITWIIPHGGAALPALATRIDALRLLAPDRCHAEEPVASYLGRLYFDLAGPRSDDALRALLGIAEASRLLFGSDWPFTPGFAVSFMLDALRATSVLDAGQMEQVFVGNARELFPRLAAP
jgi:predicted TIM-barrel fold metal-dependent hydrolase